MTNKNTRYIVINKKIFTKVDPKNFVDYFINKNIYPIIVTSKTEKVKTFIYRKIGKDYLDKVKVLRRGKSANDYLPKLATDHLVTVLGVINEDTNISFNNRLPLFYCKKFFDSNDNNNKLIKYGLELGSTFDLLKCYDSYKVDFKPYLEYDLDENSKIVSLFNANEKYADNDSLKIKRIFKNTIKHSSKEDKDNKSLVILFIFLKYFVDNCKDKNAFIGYFPSHNKINDSCLCDITEKIRTINKLKPINGKEIFVRKEDSKKKQHSKNRLNEKCDNDFKTMIVNPEVINDIKGKQVYIIDDYMTNGFSSETARHLLFQAGAKKVKFITLGKFGKAYYKTDYCLNGDVSDKFEFNFNTMINISEQMDFIENSKLLVQYLNLVTN